MKIVIDGNIGSGKSTQLKLLETKGVPVKYEPIEDWPLDMYYSNPTRWGFLFQIIILQTLKTVKGFSVYERSPLSSLNVFWELMSKTPEEDLAYRRAYDMYAWYPDVYIYINTSPDTCYNHITKRTQDGDSAVDMELLNRLDKQYLKMYEKITCSRYMVDGNKPINEVNDSITKIINTYNNE